MNIETTRDLRNWIRAPYAWPGGYEITAITNEGECLCHECARADYQWQSYEMREGYSSRIVATDVIWEGDTECCKCGRNVAAYGPVEEEASA